MKMGIARRFAKNALLQIGVNITTKLVALVLAVYLTFILDPENFGMYSWIIAIALMLDMFANFGTGNAISKFAAPAAMENRQKTFAAYFRYLFKIRLIALAICFRRNACPGNSKIGARYKPCAPHKILHRRDCGIYCGNSCCGLCFVFYNCAQ